MAIDHTTLRRRVAALVRVDIVSAFKIGRSSTPSARLSKSDYAGYDEMIAIFETHSRRSADEVEDALIQHFRDSDNYVGGGGGPDGGAPYYIYVVRRFHR